MFHKPCIEWQHGLPPQGYRHCQRLNGLSRILGFVRDMLTAQLFGAGLLAESGVLLGENLRSYLVINKLGFMQR